MNELINDDGKGATNDLPAKLRDIGRWAVEAKGVEVVYEAADEIERLRAENENLGKELQRAQADPAYDYGFSNGVRAAEAADETEYLCPHCTEVVTPTKDGRAPTHDFPKPLRQVCPGSGRFCAWITKGRSETQTS